MVPRSSLLTEFTVYVLGPENQFLLSDSSLQHDPLYPIPYFFTQKKEGKRLGSENQFLIPILFLKSEAVISGVYCIWFQLKLFRLKKVHNVCSFVKIIFN